MLQPRRVNAANAKPSDGITMHRGDFIKRLRQRSGVWDVAVIGGGATGIAIALDAATRDLDVVLLEQADFGKGTSSRSTKLIHGGVRYLRQGNITLVRDALRERALLRVNAPHLVQDRRFLIPCHTWWQRWFYWFGLKMYDWLAVRDSFGRSRGVSAPAARELVPTLKRDLLRGGVVYHDGQFDDTRLLIHMARTAAENGACLVNYMPVSGISENDEGRITGVTTTDLETGETFSIAARCVVNAAGPFCDAVRHMDDAASEPMLVVSQGVHIVLPRRFLPGDTAIIVPQTSDGRVLFIIPWHDHAIVGTTDTPIDIATPEPSARPEEIQFLLDTAAEYLTDPPTVSDVLSVFTGIRPLVKGDPSSRTASLSRDHVIRVSPSGLVTITGGKWTTARRMAEDCVDRVLRETGISAAPCRTKTLRLHGCPTEADHTTPEGNTAIEHSRRCYGTDLREIERIEADSPQLAEPLHEQLPVRGSHVVWAVRHEMARTLEDVLARRTRCLFLNAQATLTIADKVVQLMATELGTDDDWCRSQLNIFRTVAAHFLPPDTLSSPRFFGDQDDASVTR